MIPSDEVPPRDPLPRRCLGALSRALLAVLLAIPLVARSAETTVSWGPSVTGQHHWTSAVFAEAAADPWRWRALDIAPEFGLGYVRARGTAVDRLDHDVWIGFAGVRASLPGDGIWRHAFLGFGIGVTHGKTNALSSSGEFVDTLGWQVGHWDVMVRHISNGHLARGPNIGETMLLLGARF
ncbi:MAG: hypothetical protein KGI40_06050 [Xanthomonadaceae bacterium]|nr:hypothetical protein [Xanthomonadaceae bacterium]MDE2178637.1 hypothetical protein [Xanthomonadaceae bacterium]